MGEVGVIVLVRMPGGALVPIRDENDQFAAAVFTDEKSAEKFMAAHFLNPLPRQIIDLEI